MTDKPAESAVERYENAETRILWRDEVAHNVATKFVSKKEADDALAELQAKLAAAEAALAWYKNWAIVTVARERGGLWSNRDDKERAALKLEAEVDLERTRKSEMHAATERLGVDRP